jgi:hypothetical protein
MGDINKQALDDFITRSPEERHVCDECGLDDCKGGQCPKCGNCEGNCYCKPKYQGEGT